MPREVLVARGLQSPQPQAVPVKTGLGNIGPAIEDTGGEVTFESKVKDYSIQVNEPRDLFDRDTGKKVKETNKRIKFKHGLFTAKTKEEVQTIVGSKYFGAPNKALVWRRSERQKLEVRNAVRDLGVQLKERPDLLKEVVSLIKNIPGAGSMFDLPVREEETKEQTAVHSDPVTGEVIEGL